MGYFESVFTMERNTPYQPSCMSYIRGNILFHSSGTPIVTFRTLLTQITFKSEKSSFTTRYYYPIIQLKVRYFNPFIAAAIVR